MLLLLLILAPAVLVASASGARPITDFSASPLSGTAPLGVSFSDLSQNSPTGWTWFFGDETYLQEWTKVNASSGWPARFEHSSVSLPSGSIVLTGGYDGNTYYNDTWLSTDNGTSWMKMNASSGWPARKGHSTVPVGGGILLTGGADGTRKWNDTWMGTSEGVWILVNASSGAWPARLGHSSVIMSDNSIWLMGGTDGTNYFNDIWRSTNFGVTWAQLGPGLWTGRSGHSTVSMPNSSIVLTGGYTGTICKNDTYRWKDGTWTQQNASAAWPARFGHSTVAMPDGSIVLMGGYTCDSGSVNDSWRSTDNGNTWALLDESAGWPERHHASAVPMRDGSIVLAGGWSGSNLNDTWQIQPVGSSVQNPSHTYITPGSYQVSLLAYNTLPNNTRKKGYISVSETLPLSQPSAGWKYRGELNNSGVYSDGGFRPNGIERWNVSNLNNPDIGRIVSSPTVKDGVVYVGDTYNHLFAINANTGSIIWMNTLPLVAPTTEGDVWSSPAVADGVVYIGNGHTHYTGGGAFYAFDAGTGGGGTPLWQKHFPYGGIVSSPAIAYGNVYVGRQDHNVSAWNATTGAEVWTFATEYEVESSPAVDNGMVYFSVPADSPGGDNVISVNALTGSMVWDLRNISSYDGEFGAGGDNVWTSPAVADGVLYIGGLGGVYAFDAATGEQLHQFNDTIESYFPGAPAVADGLVYIGTQGASPHTFFALNADDLTVNWSNETPDDSEMWSSPAVANGVVYITSWDSNLDEKGYLYAWNATTGDPIWNFHFTRMDGSSSSPAVANGVVYFGTSDHGLIAVGTAGQNTINDVGVFRPSTQQFLLKDGAGKIKITWGESTDTPVAGDWNGDGIDEVGVHRPSLQKFILKNGTDKTIVKWGLVTDTGVAGDWNGDGMGDIGVFRSSLQKFVLKNGTEKTIVKWGQSTDLPVAGDWNGDGMGDIGVFRPSTQQFILKNGTEKTIISWGQSTDLPVAADWNGDGMDDVGVFRPAKSKFVLKNGTGMTTVTFGQSADLPVAGRWK